MQEVFHKKLHEVSSVFLLTIVIMYKNVYVPKITCINSGTCGEFFLFWPLLPRPNILAFAQKAISLFFDAQLINIQTYCINIDFSVCFSFWFPAQEGCTLQKTGQFRWEKSNFFHKNRENATFLLHNGVFFCRII